MAFKLLLEEQETHIYYDVLEKKWHADSTYAPHIRKFENKGWICTNTSYYEDGTVEGKTFESGGRKGISITDPTKTRVVSEEQREAAKQRLLDYHSKNADMKNEIDTEDIEDDFFD